MLQVGGVAGDDGGGFFAASEGGVEGIVNGAAHDTTAAGFAEGGFVVGEGEGFDAEGLFEGEGEFGGGVDGDFVKASEGGEGFGEGVGVGEGAGGVVERGEANGVLGMCFQKSADENAGIEKGHRV